MASKDGRKTYHLVYVEDDGRWKVEVEGAKRASSTHATKKEALAAARELANGQKPSQLIVHTMDGKIE